MWQQHSELPEKDLPDGSRPYWLSLRVSKAGQGFSREPAGLIDLPNALVPDMPGRSFSG